MDTLHACIKDNVVINVVIVDNENNEIIQVLKETFEYDFVIETNDPLTSVGWAYDPIIGSCVNPQVEEELPAIIESAIEEPN